MKREEAVKILQATRLMLMDGANQPISDLYYALDMAIEALEQTEPNSSEKPSNCEHITEDGVTCAKYPACDDCLDNPLNKVKGSERLVKGKDEPQKIAEDINRRVEMGMKEWNARHIETEPQTDCDHRCVQTEIGCERTDCAWK